MHHDTAITTTARGIKQGVLPSPSCLWGGGGGGGGDAGEGGGYYVCMRMITESGWRGEGQRAVQVNEWIED